jgi:hypothetical protein
MDNDGKSQHMLRFPFYGQQFNALDGGFTSMPGERAKETLPFNI